MTDRPLAVQGAEWLQDAGRWRGQVTFPGRPHPFDILIFEQAGGFIAVRARCPHEGWDLTDCPLDPDGALVCPRHGLPVQVTGPGSVAFAVEHHPDGFRIPWPLRMAARP